MGRKEAYIDVMKTLRFALAPVIASICFALPAAAEKLSLKELSTYLNSLGTVQADFVQKNDDGSSAKGVLTLLSRAKMVVSHTEKNGDTIVRAQDPEHPEYGSIDLIFSGAPILKAWVIHDEGGGSTTVQLTKMRLGGTVRDAEFNIRSEARRRGTPLE